MLAWCLAFASYGCTGGAPVSVRDASATDAPAVDAPADAGPPDPGVLVRLCPGAREPTPEGLVASDFDRFSYAGFSEINVVFCNPLIPEPRDELVFFVILADHFGLPRSDLTDAWAETDEGRSEGGFVWDGGDIFDEHHVGGLLTGPTTTPEGATLIGPGTAELALTLGGIGREDDVVFRWEREFLPR